MMLLIKLTVLVMFTVIILWVSWKALRDPHSHGFFRTFAWEAILILIVLNLETWFRNPFAVLQIVSWLLLLLSIVLVYQGFKQLGKKGRPDSTRADPSLITIEKTTELVTSGVYAQIRHPLYSSLLCLTWGVFLKDMSLAGVSVAVVASFFLYMTAKMEEVENLKYFGEAYHVYMRKTKMFIPFLV